MIYKRFIFTVMVSLCFLTSGISYAGQACEQKPLSVTMLKRALAQAVKTIEKLNASGADVVIIGRVGQDLSKYGQHFSHLGFAYKEDNTWHIVHKLNTCGTGLSNIFEQGMGMFFLDNPFKYEAAIAIPTPEMQKQLWMVLKDPQKVLTEHAEQYSMLAYAWGNKYQQSNQWVLETLALAMSPQIKNREQAQAWLKLNEYEPTVLNIGPMKRLGARIFKANIAFDDHPSEKRYSDKIETITADSVFAFLKKAPFNASYFTVSL